MAPSIPEDQIALAFSRLDRVTEIQRILVDQLTVLETMNPLDFLDFRDFLYPASGFQSAQWRLIENKLGLKPEKRVPYGGQKYSCRVAEADMPKVLAAEAEPTILELVTAWLERTPFVDSEEFKFWPQYKQKVKEMLEEDAAAVNENALLTDKGPALESIQATQEKFDTLFDEEKYNAARDAGECMFSYKAMQACLLIHLYHEEHILALPYRLLSKLKDIDEYMTSWRHKHALMVHRMLGIKIGTGGSSGFQYLSYTAQKHRVFVDLFNITTFFIPRQILPKLPPSLTNSMRFTKEV